MLRLELPSRYLRTLSLTRAGSVAGKSCRGSRVNDTVPYQIDWCTPFASVPGLLPGVRACWVSEDCSRVVFLLRFQDWPSLPHTESSPLHTDYSLRQLFL